MTGALVSNDQPRALHLVRDAAQPDLLADLETLTHAYTRFLRAQMAKEGFGDLTVAMLRLLNRVHAGRSTVRDLAAIEPMTQQAVSKYTILLERLRYLEQRADSVDRRVNRLHLTEHGHNALRTEQHARNKVNAVMTADLGASITTALTAAVDDLPSGGR